MWGNRLANKQIRITKLQKWAAYLILDADLSIPSSDLFKKLKWLPFPKYVEYQHAVTVHKSLNELNPHYMKNLFSYTQETPCNLLTTVPSRYGPLPERPTTRLIYYILEELVVRVSGHYGPLPERPTTRTANFLVTMAPSSWSLWPTPQKGDIRQVIINKDLKERETSNPKCTLLGNGGSGQL